MLSLFIVAARRSRLLLSRTPCSTLSASRSDEIRAVKVARPCRFAVDRAPLRSEAIITLFRPPPWICFPVTAAEPCVSQAARSRALSTLKLLDLKSSTKRLARMVARHPHASETSSTTNAYPSPRPGSYTPSKRDGSAALPRWRFCFSSFTRRCTLYTHPVCSPVCFC